MYIVWRVGNNIVCTAIQVDVKINLSPNHFINNDQYIFRVPILYEIAGMLVFFGVLNNDLR